jgi:hypothetical protein
MKANELMIDDWVRIKYPDKYEGAIGKICSLTLLEGGYYAINISDVHFGYLMTEVFCEDIEPIPLTAEILEKNGFTCDANSMNDSDEFIVSVEYGEYQRNTNDGFKMLSDGKIIKYVHELQHALRLCEVEKEIEL